MTTKKMAGWTIIAMLFTGFVAFLSWCYGWQGVAFVLGFTIVIGWLLYIAIDLITE